VRVRSISPHELREAHLVRAELEALATEVATPRMTRDDLAALDEAERRFSELTLIGTDAGELRVPDVICAAAAMPLVERLAKGARRTFIGDRVWSARVELDELYAKNDLQHRAILAAIEAGSASGARLLAREHVLSSGRLIEAVLESVGGARDPGWGS
jgi:DNA-binding GntR family transcriptional regulator